MKLKQFVATLGLVSFLGLGVGIGLKASQPKEAKATGETWMINATFDAKAIIEWDGVDLDSFVFRCGMDGQGGWVEKTMTHTGAANLYNANVTFTDEFEFNRVQVKFTQGGVEKWANTVSLSGTKAEHQGSYNLSYSSWDDGNNFNITGSTFGNPYFKYNDVQHNFVEDVANARYVARDVVISEVDDNIYYVLQYAGVWKYTKDTLTATTLANYFSPYGWNLSAEWCVMAVTGTYDIFLNDSYSDGGIVEFKKHETTNSYIYYVTQSDQSTPDFIYTYGGGEAFGAWPGKSIHALVDVEELFLESTDFKYCGSDGEARNRVVYKIPVTIGYPADNMLVIHNNKGQQTSDLEIVAHRAYFWKDDNSFANDNDGVALDFLLQAEEMRKAAANSSICAISQANALTLWTAYQGLTVPQKALVDGSFVLTYDSTLEVGTYGDVYYSAIMQKIGVIAGALTNSSSINPLLNSNANTAIVITAIIAASTLVALFFVIRRRKHN